jgi:hypothetical protein
MDKTTYIIVIIEDKKECSYVRILWGDYSFRSTYEPGESWVFEGKEESLFSAKGLSLKYPGRTFQVRSITEATVESFREEPQ